MIGPGTNSAGDRTWTYTHTAGSIGILLGDRAVSGGAEVVNVGEIDGAYPSGYETNMHLHGDVMGVNNCTIEFCDIAIQVGCRLHLSGNWIQSETSNIDFETGGWPVMSAGNKWIDDQFAEISDLDTTTQINLNGGSYSKHQGRTVALQNLTFPAVQVASSNLNTLDDYEEGTFTPVLSRASTPPTTVTYTSRSGDYVKVGKKVTVWVQIRVSDLSADGSGLNEVTGLPFTAANITNVQLGSVGYNDVFDTSDAKAALVVNNTTTVQFIPVGIGQGNISENYRAVAAGDRFLDFSVTYFTA